MYTSYFGFSAMPFNVTPDPRFFYTNPVYQEAYASLLYGIRERKGFIMLTGEVGTGKTTLLRRLMNDLAATTRFAYFYYTNLSFEELLSFTCTDLGLRVERDSRLRNIEKLNEFLMLQLGKGKRVVLLIDEAQNLGGEVLEDLRLLSNLETASEKLLQIVLVGQPELLNGLHQPKLRQLKQRIAVRCQLDRLKDREVGPYIDCRLGKVGYERDGLFTSDAIQQIACYSKGIPRLINLICNNALIIAYATSKKNVSAKIIEEVAYDLQLKQETQVTKLEGPTAETSVMVSVNRKGKEFEIRRNKPVQRSRKRVAWIGVRTLLALLFLGGAGALIYPLQSKDLLSNLSREVEDFKSHKVGDLIALVGERLGFFEQKAETPLPVPISDGAKSGKVLSEPVAEPGLKTQGERLQPAGAESLAPVERVGLASSPTLATVKLMLETKGVKDMAEASRLERGLLVPSVPYGWRKRPIVVKRGTTVSYILFKVYGDYNTLAMDLIKEFNPHVGDLDWVITGEKLLVPPLTRETLLRKKEDGSYHIILSSFSSFVRAAEFAEIVGHKGYRVVLTPRRVADGLRLYRVEIVGLKNLESANQAWDMAIANRWISTS